MGPPVLRCAHPGNHSKGHDMMNQAHDLCTRINAILSLAQDRRIAADVARHDFGWQTSMSDADAIAQLAQFKHRLVPGLRKKYIVLDLTSDGRTGSGLLIIDTTTGAIYGIKAYGVPNRIHQYGTITAPSILSIAMKASVLERAYITRAYQELEPATA
jgi:hypothetical protein